MTITEDFELMFNQTFHLKQVSVESVYDHRLSADLRQKVISKPEVYVKTAKSLWDDVDKDNGKEKTGLQTLLKSLMDCKLKYRDEGYDHIVSELEYGYRGRKITVKANNLSEDQIKLLTNTDVFKLSVYTLIIMKCPQDEDNIVYLDNIYAFLQSSYMDSMVKIQDDSPTCCNDCLSDHLYKKIWILSMFKTRYNLPIIANKRNWREADMAEVRNVMILWSALFRRKLLKTKSIISYIISATDYNVISNINSIVGYNAINYLIHNITNPSIQELEQGVNTKLVMLEYRNKVAYMSVAVVKTNETIIKDLQYNNDGIEQSCIKISLIYYMLSVIIVLFPIVHNIACDGCYEKYTIDPTSASQLGIGLCAIILMILRNFITKNLDYSSLLTGKYIATKYSEMTKIGRTKLDRITVIDLVHNETLFNIISNEGLCPLVNKLKGKFDIERKYTVTDWLKAGVSVYNILATNNILVTLPVELTRIEDLDEESEGLIGTVNGNTAHITDDYYITDAQVLADVQQTRGNLIVGLTNKP